MTPSRLTVSDDFNLLPYLVAFAFLWGAIWGSFLNVVIWRLPRGASLSTPASHCPKCQTPIRWHDNIPMLGWLFLGGKCRDCEAPISARYPGIELLIALLSAALMWHVAAGRLDAETVGQVLMVFALHFYFVLILVAIAFIDLDLTIIPHKLSMPLIAWGFLTAILLPKTGVWETYDPYTDWLSSLIGFGAGFGLLFAVFSGYKLVRGVDGGGGGDLWLLGAIGANLGWLSLIFVLMAASLQGLLAALGASVIARARGGRPGDGDGLLIQGAHTEEYWEDHPVLGTPRDDAQQADAAAGSESAVGGSESEDGGSTTPDAEADDDFMQLAVPFGPFLALAAIEYIFFGRYLVALYAPGW